MGLLATGNAGNGAIVRGYFQLQAGQVLKTGRQQRSALREFLDRSMLLLSLIL
jgi:hypothetical protein